MTRKDIVIISVLINAGLLAILFVMAMNVQEDNVVEDQTALNVAIEKNIAKNPSEPEIIPLATLSNIHQGEDELDKVLKDYSIPPSQPEIFDEENPEELRKESDNSIIALQMPVNEDSDYLEITVKRGDALEKIARANGVSVATIKKVNQLKSEKISIGQVLKIPKSSKTEIVQTTNKISPKKETEENSNEVVYYTIKSGDNPWKIAKQHHVNFEDLLKLNNLNEERARNLKIGDKIRVK